jgi:hypothetical protein
VTVKWYPKDFRKKIESSIRAAKKSMELTVTILSASAPASFTLEV